MTAINKSIMTTIKLPKPIYQRLLNRVVNDGYGLRGKSKWIIDAIEIFLALPNYPELVDIANDMEDLTEMVSMRLHSELMTKIDRAVIEVRLQYPAMEAVRSNIIRASIIQAIIRNPASATEEHRN